MRNVRVKLFGEFRKYVPEGFLDIELSEANQVSDLKNKIAVAIKNINSQFDVVTLLQESVVATNEEILTESDFINENTELAVLPPVCGG